MSAAYEIEQFDRAETFLAALGRWGARWQPFPEHWIFRGQGDADHSLTPTAFRHESAFFYGANRPFTPRPTHGEQVAAEASLVRLFLEQADEQARAIPGEATYQFTHWATVARRVDTASHGTEDWPPADLAPLFALAQHHGLPTRLLDWTRKPLVAAYFAGVGGANRHEQSHGSSEFLSVWGLNTEFAMWLARRSDYWLKIVVPPRASNPNLHVQGGVFTLLRAKHCTPDSPGALPALNSLIEQAADSVTTEEHKKHGALYPVLRRIDLKIREAGKLLRMLSKDLVSGTHLFPGFDGVVRGIKERALWDIVKFTEEPESL